MAGNIGMHYGLGGEALAKKGEELKTQGEANRAQGQKRIDIENEAMRGEKRKNYDDFAKEENPEANNNEANNSSDSNDLPTNDRIAELEATQAELIQALEAANNDKNATEEQKQEIDTEKNNMVSQIESVKSQVSSMQQDYQKAFGDGKIVSSQEARNAQSEMGSSQERYFIAKEENGNDMAAWQKALAEQEKASERLQQAIAQYEAAKGSPDEANAKQKVGNAEQEHRNAMNNARQKEMKAHSSKDEMTSAARSYQLNRMRSKAHQDGTRFNEQNAKAYIDAHLSTIMERLNRVQEAGPRNVF